MRRDSSGARGANRDFQEAATEVVRARRCPPGIVPFPILARTTLSKAAAHARPAIAGITGLATQIRHQDSLGRPDSVVSRAVWAAEGHRGGASRPAGAATFAQCHRDGKSARTRCRGGRQAGPSASSGPPTAAGAAPPRKWPHVDPRRGDGCSSLAGRARRQPPAPANPTRELPTRVAVGACGPE